MDKEGPDPAGEYGPSSGGSRSDSEVAPAPSSLESRRNVHYETMLI